MTNYVEFGTNRIDYTVVRRKRKTIGISVSPEYGVQVAAPKWISDSQLKNIVMDKAPWILKKLAQMDEIRKETVQRNFVSGESFLYLGKEYKLETREQNNIRSVKITLTDQSIIVNIPLKLPEEGSADSIRRSLINWYREQAREVVGNRMEIYKSLLKVSPLKMIIKEQKRIWGSCSGKNIININWKIIMAPPPIIDYLVVHELSHIRVRNHSKQFWNLVESILPDYKERSNWLKLNGVKLK